MLIPLNRFKAALQLLLQRQGDGCSVLIFVAPSVDALSACAILVSLLKLHDVKFTMVPVLGYEHLRKQAQQYLADGDFRNVVLIDCGSVVDVSEYFVLGGSDGVCAFVIDYHRPVHRANIHNRDNVIVFADTETVPDPRGPSPAPEPQEDRDLEGDARSGGESEDSPQKRARTSSSEAGVDNDGGALDDQVAMDANNIGRGGGLVVDDKFAADYASGSFYGTSSSVLMYELAAQCSAENSSSVLWMAIVGLTEHYLMHRCSTKQYNKQFETFRLASCVSSDPSLKFERHEYQFVLYRHWSLYDSMFHSPQVAARLGIWSEGGRRKLDQLLAKMGFPLKDCKEPFLNMQHQLKQGLSGSLAEHVQEFGLDDMTFPSFVLNLDAKLALSASDCVLAVSSLIEGGFSNSTRPAEASSDDDNWGTTVLAAYDALSAVHSEGRIDVLSKGVKGAKDLQQALVREGVDLLLKKVIVRNGPFRYGLLQDTGGKFCNCQALTRLALFVLEALKKPNKASKPLVLCALNRQKNSYLVLGVTPAAPGTRAKRNDFGISFHQAALMTGTRVSFHSFDSSVIEVAAGDISRFLELLHSGLIAE